VPVVTFVVVLVVPVMLRVPGSPTGPPASPPSTTGLARVTTAPLHRGDRAVAGGQGELHRERSSVRAPVPDV